MSPRRFILAAALACLPPAEALAAEPVVFATVGPTGEFRTVQAAIDALPARGAASRVIRIQPGAYFGRTVLNKARVTLRGSGPDTLLTCNLGQAMPGEDGQPMGWQGAAALRIAEYGSRGPGAKLDARVPWATTSASPAPAGFERSAVLGDWKPAPPS